MTRRLSRRIVSALLRRIRVGSLVVVEGGERHVYGSGAPIATVRVRCLPGVADAAPRQPRAGGSVRSGPVGLAGPGGADQAGGAERRGARPAPCAPGAGALAVAARRRSAAPRHEAAGPARHLRPLRPRQRPVLADARSDDELLVRDLRAPRDDARAGPARKARADLREAAAGSAGSGDRDRKRLGGVRALRRQDPWLPCHHDDDLARAARATCSSGSGARDWTTRSRC